MKKKVFLMSLASLLLFSVASCANSKGDDSTSKTFEVSDFSSLNLELVGEVFYVQTDSFYLNVTGSSTLIEALTVSNRNGELSIELNKKRNLSVGKRKLVINVGSPQLKAINYESVGTLYINNRLETDSLSINNEGVGKIVMADAHIGHFTLSTMSVGLVKIKGMAHNVLIESDGVGKIECSEFKANNVKVESNGVGSILVYAYERIDVSLSGIGSVSYYGNPAEVKTDISGIGKVNRMD